MQSLQDKEVAALRKLLRAGAESDKIQWKILVYDAYCRDILAPLLRVGDLRKLGVTLHLLVESQRQPIPDAPAVYFMRPTEENVRQFCADCKQDLYQHYYLNFVHPVPRSLLELMAQELVALPRVTHITLYDQYLNFLALEPDLFSLEMSDSYRTLHAPPALVSDQDLDAYITEIVGGLTSVVLQMQVVPVVMSVKGGAAQRVAEKVTLRLTDMLREKQIKPQATVSTPVLLVFDRHLDVPSCLAHTWTYRSMLHDVLGMRLNRVELQEGEEGGGPKTYELDTRDQFWHENAGQPYPVVADRASEQLEAYKQQKDRVTRQTEGLEESMDTVAELMQSVPQMKEHKRIVDMHTNLAFGLLSQVKERSLDAFYHTEQALLRGSGWDKEKLQTLLSGKGSADPSDRLRLFLIYYFTLQGQGDAAEGEITKWERVLVDAGIDISAYQFLKTMQQQQQQEEAEWQGEGDRKGARGWFGAGLSAYRNHLSYQGLGDALGKAKEGLGKAKTQLESTFKQKGVLLPLTRMVDAVLQDPTPNGKRELSDLCCWDPRTGSKIDAAALHFTHAIVFGVGGGAYTEYQNLKEWEKEQTTRKSVVYGCTELVSPEAMLQQLSYMGRHT